MGGSAGSRVGSGAAPAAAHSGGARAGAIRGGAVGSPRWHPVLLPHLMTQQLALYLPDSSTGMQKKNGQSLGPVQTLIDSSERQLGIVEHVWSEGDW